MNNDKKLRYFIKYKDLYVYNISIDYDGEFSITFTSQMKSARRFNFENLTVIKEFILIYFDDIEVIIEEGENDA